MTLKVHFHLKTYTSEGIVNSVFSNNGTGVFFEEPNPLVNSFQQGGNHTAGTYTGNTFTNNGTGFKGYMSGLTLASGTFNGNNIGIDLNGDGNINSSVVQYNTLNVGSNSIGIRISLGVKAAWNIITGSTAQQGTGIFMGHITEAENNTLQSLGVGIEVSTNSYNLVAIQKNTFTDNLSGIRFTPIPGITTGNSAPPIIACNTFSAAGILSSSTVGIYIPQGVRMVAPNYGMNRLGADLINFSGTPNGNHFDLSIDVPVINLDPVKLIYFRYATSSMELHQSRVNSNSVGVTPVSGTTATAATCSGLNGPGVYDRMSNTRLEEGTKTKPEVMILLGQSYPNPASNEATISYQLPGSLKSAELVFREVMTGKIVKTLDLKPNEKMVNVNLQGFRKGLYAYTLVVDGKPVATKMILVDK